MRNLLWTLPDELQTQFSLRELTHHEHSEFQTRTVRRGQRTRKHFEFQFVADVCPPFAGPYLFNFEVIFC